MTEEIALLQEYARTGSQPAFAEVAQRYVNLVYSAARRQVYGDEHDAEDVTQAVFQLLAQRAKSVPVDRPLSGWLLKVTGYCAANARRARGRRENHERRAASMAATSSDGTSEWDELSPLLDQGLGKLPAADRDALVLRFMEQKSMRQVGEAMGISEEAAQKRVMRAVDKLREFFQRRGVATMSAVALATLLTTKSVQAAPATLATSVASASGASAAAGSSATLAKGALIIMATEKMKTAAIVGVLLLLGIGGGIVAWNALVPARSKRVVVDPVAASAFKAVRNDSKWPVKFSDGTTLDVLALNDPNADAGKWWLPDGSAAVDPKFRANGSITMSYLFGRRIDMILRLRGSDLPAKGLAVRSDSWGATGHDTAILASGSATDEMMKVITVVNKQPTGKLLFGIATGKWTGELNLPCADGQLPPEGATGAGFTFNGITEEKGQTIIHVRSLPEARDEDQQLVVVENGKELHHKLMYSNLLEDTYYFPCPNAKVTRIIARSRPYEWMELKNVALNPTTTTTAVEVSAATQAAPSTQTAKGY